MLNRFDTVFVKNDYGSYGWGVYKIEKDQDCYSCISGGEDTKTIFFVDLWEMYEFLESRLGKRGVIQQGINSARVMGKIFDLRVNAQKNIHGEWTLSIVSVRVAPEGAAVTNTSQGAQEIVLGLYEQVPFGLFEWDKLCDLSYRILLALEANFGKLGEIGLDIGIDIKGKLWVYEVNSKPSTTGYENLITGEECRKLLGLPLDYALHLSEKACLATF